MDIAHTEEPSGLASNASVRRSPAPATRFQEAIHGHTGARRSNEEATHELVMNGVSDVLLNIEHDLSRAKKVRVQAAKADEEVNAKLATPTGK
ncbi:MAG: hypothetical protein PVSMB10_07890 [Pseudarthrobacter sp.]